jgi:hypothetical protein
MSDITPRQVLIATEIRVISRKMIEIVGSKSNGLVLCQLGDEIAMRQCQVPAFSLQRWRHDIIDYVSTNREDTVIVH